jgi:tetratricopeptide (TPR) repeat protein
VRVGKTEVAAVRDMTRVFTDTDERLGGSYARSAVVEYLCTDVTAYCRGSFAHDDDRRAMFGAAAELAYLAGWKAHDAGLAGLAQRYYLHAFEFAAESDPGAHAGYVLRILAHQALDLGEREHCVDLATGALARARGKVGPDTESLFWLTLARAQAANKSARAATNALRRAETQLERAGEEQAPGWASLGGPAEARLASQSGKTLGDLGVLRAAEHQFARSATCWNPVTHPRVHALTLAQLGDVQCARGNLEAACETWSKALDGMAGVTSARTRDAVTSMRSHLAAFRGREIPAARRLDMRAAAVQAVM